MAGATIPTTSQCTSQHDLADHKANLDTKERTIERIAIVILVSKHQGLPHAVASCHHLLLIW
jgi:hypothetical protein